MFSSVQRYIEMIASHAFMITGPLMLTQVGCWALRLSGASPLIWLTQAGAGHC